MSKILTNTKHPHKLTTDELNQAVSLLHDGKLIVIPTETVYGLAADAKNPSAIAKIFEIKKREKDQPISILISDESQLTKWAIDISKTAYKLAKVFWPGPLTIVLKRAPHVLDILTGGSNTIGLRVPDHPITQQILQAFQNGIATTSANQSGQKNPTHVEDVRKTLGKTIDLIIDGGPCQIGVASTVIDLSSKKPKILRQGTITKNAIEKVIDI